MTNQEIYDLHVLQSHNVRRLKQAQENLIKDINFYLKKQDNFQVEIKTKLLALLYSALSEAQFIQIVHTPNGFTYSEIQTIKSKKPLAEKWKTMVDLAMGRIDDWQSDSNLLNKRDKLHDIIKTYIEDPQELRNRIAHGQWIYALNTKLSKENEAISQRIRGLDVVKITIWAEVHQYLAFIVRDLVQSPNMAFNVNFITNLSKLDSFVAESQQWSLEKRILRLSKKNIK